ncbi:flagellar protein FlgN [Paucibacter sp. R3-3]|uniref:Flagellar protein FlgN n=1 Tax=Roseateles agri TaxID=3098619 RepID=A0ABU5DMA5_9BURK|nr:flagellar protein FlgN [Paucibacter sp. R3-3]MDY0747426.1 flagellar protein FlgN [Paucibacter sp. R3-3]
MNLADILRLLLTDMQADLRSYARLHGLLDDQLAAITQQRGDELQGIATQVTALVDELDGRRDQRRRLVATMLGRKHELSMNEALERLPSKAASVLRDAWQALEQAVQLAKQLNARNCELIVEQHALMQRLLGSNQDTYAEL